jgi:hypothetical protein
MTEMRIFAIILNWNAAEDTVRCVRRVASWETVQPTIIVVDNASTDGSPQIIARECPDVCLLGNPVNLGFAGGNNRGIEEALRRGDAPILLLNNDAQIEQQDIIMLLESLLTHQRIGLIGPLLFDAHRREKLLAAGSRDPSRHHHSHIRRLPSAKPVQIVECVPGTAVLVRGKVFREVGPLDEDYFFASEVVDLCLRARQQGYLTAVDTRARAFHDLERSSDLRETLYSYYIIRNRFLLIRKFHRESRLMFRTFWALYSLSLSLKVQLTGQRATARAIRLGLLDGLQGRFGGQNERVRAAVSGSGGRSGHLAGLLRR